MWVRQVSEGGRISVSTIHHFQLSSSSSRKWEAKHASCVHVPPTVFTRCKIAEDKNEQYLADLSLALFTEVILSVHSRRLGGFICRDRDQPTTKHTSVLIEREKWNQIPWIAPNGFFERELCSLCIGWVSCPLRLRNRTLRFMWYRTFGQATVQCPPIIKSISYLWLRIMSFLCVCSNRMELNQTWPVFCWLSCLIWISRCSSHIARFRAT